MKPITVVLAVAIINLLGSHEAILAQSKANTVPTLRVMDAKVAASMRAIVENYLLLKNALINDKSKDAATVGKAIVGVLDSVDTSPLTVDEKKLFKDVEDDAREQAEHIGENAGNIAHQREHFEMLSKDVYDLVKAFGSHRVLYKDFCPMYNDAKGAMWLSETKAIKNPYYGKKMFTCGSVQEVIK